MDVEEWLLQSRGEKKCPKVNPRHVSKVALHPMADVGHRMRGVASIALRGSDILELDGRKVFNYLVSAGLPTPEITKLDLICRSRAAAVSDLERRLAAIVGCASQDMWRKFQRVKAPTAHVWAFLRTSASLQAMCA